MSLLRRIRAELAGACRSVRYDLGRRPVAVSAHGPDVTSTGMNTFGGCDFDEPSPRSPRRAAAVTALGILTVMGAAGAYLAVVNGLGSLMRETPASADTFPPRPAVTSTITPVTGIGGGPAPRHVATARPTTKAVPRRVAPQSKRNVSPIRTTNPASLLAYPPVPTPTAPAPPAVTPPPPPPGSNPSGVSKPSGGSRPSGGSESSDGSPQPTESDATPGASTDTTETPQGRHRRRH
jgi:hypothetical protein